MADIMDLKQIERKAYRFTYQDGLWDIYMGIIVIGISQYVHRPASGYSAINLIWFVLTFALGQSIYWAGKKYITVPRMGQVQFGSIRKQRGKILAIILGIVVFIQVAMVMLTAIGWQNPTFGQELFGNINQGQLVVAALGSLFVGPSMLIIAYMNDFPRGYYIGILMALAVFMMIYFNQPVHALIIGAMIILPGLMLFIRFLRRYPIPHGDEVHG